MEDFGGPTQTRLGRGGLLRNAEAEPGMHSRLGQMAFEFPTYNWPRNQIKFQQALHLRKSRTKRAAELTTAERIATRDAYLLDEIRKDIVFEGSPDIIEVLNEFVEQETEDSPTERPPD